MAHHHHRHCDEIGKSSKTRKKGMGVVRLGRRETKKKKKNARKKRDKSLPCVDVSRFIIIFLPLFFSFYSSFLSIATKGAKLKGLRG